MNFKKLFLFTLFCLPIFVFAQSTHKLSDYGLTSEQTKELTSQQIKEILSQPTPDEISKGMDEAREKGVEYSYPKGYPVQIVKREPIPNTVNCFDYYKFNSVQTNITLSTTTVKAGDTANFFGTIRNENNYPIIDGKFYVKIFKIRKNQIGPNGQDVVDQFVVKENIVIPANGEIPVSFDWKIPQNLESGKYSLISYFVVDDKFNLLGLSFTDDVVGNNFDFVLINGKKIISFDKDKVKINGSPYYFAAFAPRISIGTNAVIDSTIMNNTDKDEKVEIVSKLYKWDSMNQQNFVRESKQEILIKANSSSVYQFVVPEEDSSVYFIVEELRYKDSKSILNIRFVRPDFDRIRINFPSILEYPIKKNSTSTVFSCLHNSGTSDFVDNGKMVLKVLDKKDKLVHEYTYSGVVTGDMMAIKDDFISKKDLKDFSVEATLWQGDMVVDHSVMKYVCEDITPGKCSDNFVLYVFSIILLIVITGLIVVFLKKSNIKTFYEKQ